MVDTLLVRMRGSTLLPERSVVRRIDREMFVLLGGPAALLLQVAHPLVAAGVDRWSDFRRDPVGRLRRTLDTTLAPAFGDDRAARRAIARINRIHTSVRGVASGGRPYDARDPRLLVWVEATLVLTSLRLYEVVMGRLPQDERDAYWTETKPIAALLGIPEGAMPATLADLERFERDMLATEVIPDETARAVGRDVLRPFRWIPGPLYWPTDAIAAAMLPPTLREAFGLRYGRAERLFFRGVVVGVRWLRRIAPEMFTVIPQARRFERGTK